jgi:phytoene dehydrogenase-like protein
MDMGYDYVMVGSGHNTLIAAASLAKAGYQVLQKNDRTGGLVRTEELTLSGFKHDTFSSSHPLFVSGPAYAELGAELARRGLNYINTDFPTGVSMTDGGIAGRSRALTPRLRSGNG